jgi:uncharacterized protein YeaO (DUF488 family)
MTLEVWTARLSTKDPDAFNVTRKTGNPVFAPSWGLVAPMIQIRREGRAANDEEWRSYARAYLREMKASLSTNKLVWDALLARQRVVLTCYCTNPHRCHRTLLGLFLAKQGAVFQGELPPEDQAERDAFDLMVGLD